MLIHVFFRVDGGKNDGLGHIKRCISLSKSIKNRSVFYRPVFIINKKNSTSKIILIKNDCKYLEVNGKINSVKETLELKKILLLNKPSILILDSKRISKNYVTDLKKFSKVIIFEDEKKYFSNPHLLINSNDWAKKFYKNSNNKLLGIKYNTISFKFFKKNGFDVRSNKILISMGGEDPNNVTLKLISIIYKSIPKIKFLIILGHSHPNRRSVKEFCEEKSIDHKIINNPEDISVFLTNLRFVISAGGLSAYEFASARIPQLITILDKHQFKIANMIKKKNCGNILNYNSNLNSIKISHKFKNFFNNQEQLLTMSKNTKKLIKNSGCEKIINNILKIV